MKQCHYNEAISSHRKSRGRHEMDQPRDEMLMSFKNFEIFLLKISSASLNPVRRAMRRTCRWIHIPRRQRISSLLYHTNLISIDFVRYLHNRTGRISILARATTMPGAEFSQSTSNAEISPLSTSRCTLNCLSIQHQHSSWWCHSRAEVSCRGYAAPNWKYDMEKTRIRLFLMFMFIVVSILKGQRCCALCNLMTTAVLTRVHHFFYGLEIMFPDSSRFSAWKCEHVLPPPSLPLSEML